MEINKNDCKKASFLIEKQMHTSLKFAEQIALRLHLFGCSWCKTYQHQSKTIEQTMIGILNNQSEKKLSANFKKQLHIMITENLKKST